MDFGSILSQVAHAVLFPLILGGLALAFPYRKTAVMRPLTPEEIKVIQKPLVGYNLLGVVLFFMVIPLIAWLVYDFLKTMYHLLPKPSDAFTYVFTFDDTFWGLPGVSIGFGAVMPVMVMLGNQYYGVERYALINHAYNQQHDIDGEVVVRWMNRLFVGFGLITIGFCYTNYAGVQGREVVINKMLEIRERRYPFEQLTRLTYVDYRTVNQYKVERWSFYEMEFNDGFVWDTNEFGRGMPLAGDLPIFEYLSQQTGIRIDSTERVKRLDQ